MSVKVAELASHTIDAPPADIFLPLAEEEFPYGWRMVPETLPDGRTLYRQVPLTYADTLDPQLGDEMPQDEIHASISTLIYQMLKAFYADDPETAVFYDLKFLWGIPGLKEPAPDVAVVPRLKSKSQRRRSSFDVAHEKTRPCLVIEVNSPRYPGDDTAKKDIYRQAGVLEYILINPHAGRGKDEFHLKGYQLVGRAYEEIRPDEEGRLFSQTTGILFGLDKKRQEVILTEAATGRRLLSLTDERRTRQAAERRAAAEAEVRIYEVAARLAAERRAAEEAAARAAAKAEAERRVAEAERRAAEEAAARAAAKAEAERRVATEAAARAAAEDARQAAEEEVARLREKLKRLEEQGSEAIPPE
jgi:Uma2 family endonuclease